MIETKESLSFKRLKMQCRRGMLELDVLLEPFLADVYLTLDEEDKLRFARLLTCEDQDLFPWFMQREVPEDPNHARIVDLIVSRVQPENYRA
ncbi:succinate dehydrogenase assembly factor 2 [Marinomonas sp. M1K-6]|uniref:FAD assembly factor SdhE n=1 Tax=Marinomonas profundi TaxID=2726122 RepID=A0A847QY50_9GAMM|nr:succinate dehydrogenase assembly factor 2 [Marinomonas profundi]NLQ18948.1 succinate dehydrogenase assembly factor 2 [Marinomonas profundi]UDV02313.1 succinate dehydrogenase assembly factor 2 [Marinomonas profundi]